MFRIIFLISYVYILVIYAQFLLVLKCFVCLKHYFVLTFERFWLPTVYEVNLFFSELMLFHWLSLFLLGCSAVTLISVLLELLSFPFWITLGHFVLGVLYFNLLYLGVEFIVHFWWDSATFSNLWNIILNHL